MDKKYCLITGGGGFLAYYFAEALIEKKLNICLADISRKNLIKNKTKLENKYNVKIKTEFLDVTKEKSIDSFLKKNQRYFFNILVNNATKDYKVGSNISAAFKNLTEIKFNDWKKDLEINLSSYFYMINKLGKIMIKKKSGNIINIASELSKIAPNQQLYNEDKKIKFYKPITYSVCKHGIIGLTKYIAASWSLFNIRCNSLSPGSVKKNQLRKFENKINKLIPMGRMLNPEELKSSIKFLVDEKNSYFTGQNLIVDGGRTII